MARRTRFFNSTISKTPSPHHQTSVALLDCVPSKHASVAPFQRAQSHQVESVREKKVCFSTCERSLEVSYWKHAFHTPEAACPKSPGPESAMLNAPRSKAFCSSRFQRAQWQSWICDVRSKYYQQKWVLYWFCFA